jgi:hypothetical protein
MKFYGIIDRNNKLQVSAKNKMPALYRSRKSAEYYNTRRTFPGRVVELTLEIKENA